MNEVINHIKLFYYERDKNSHDWLFNFQNSSEAWHLAPNLLLEKEPEVQLYGANILYDKVRHGWNLLSVEQRDSLRSTLLTYLIKLTDRSSSSVPSYIISKLAVTMSLLAVQTKNGVDDLLNQALNIICKKQPFVAMQLIKVLPEAVDKAILRRKETTNLKLILRKNVDRILNFLSCLLLESKTQNDRIDILKCIEMWIPEPVGIHCGILLKNNILQLLIQLWRHSLENISKNDDNDINDDCKILKLTCKIISSSVSIPQYKENVQINNALMYLIKNIGDLYNFILPLCEQIDHTDLCHSMCLMISCIGENSIEYIANGNVECLKFVQLMLRFTIHSHDTIVELCFDFWLALQTIDVNKRHPQLQRAVYFDLLKCLIQRLNYKNCINNDSNSLLRLRMYSNDLFVTIYDLLELDFLNILVNIIKENSFNVDWTLLEILLMTINIVKENIEESYTIFENSYNEFLVSLLSLSIINSTPANQHPMVINAICDFCISYSWWLSEKNNNNNLRLKLAEFLIYSVSLINHDFAVVLKRYTNKIHSSIGTAFRHICLKWRFDLIPTYQHLIEIIQQILQTLQLNISPTSNEHRILIRQTQSLFIETCGYMIRMLWKRSEQIEREKSLQLIFIPLFNGIEHVINNAPKSNDSFVIEHLVSYLEFLGILYGTLRIGDELPTSEYLKSKNQKMKNRSALKIIENRINMPRNGAEDVSSYPAALTHERIWSIITKVVEYWGNRVDVVNELCGIFDALIITMNTQIIDTFVPISKTVLECYQHTSAMSSKCLLVLTSLITVFGDNTNFHPHIIEILMHTIQLTCQIPLNQTYPDTITGIYILAKEVMICCPKILMNLNNSSILFQLLSLSLKCLQPEMCTDRDSTSIILQFWIEILKYCGEVNIVEVRDHIYNLVPQLLHVLLLGLAGALNTSLSQDIISDTIHQILQNGQISHNWLLSVSNSSQLRDTCHNLSQNDFLKIFNALWIMRNASKRMFRSVSKDTARIFRGFGDIDCLLSYEIKVK